MQKKQVFSVILSALFTLLYSIQGHAGDLEWSGVYRIEGYHIRNPRLDKKGRDLSYGLHHLILRPKIVAGDGLTIYGQFHLLNSAGYPNSQIGDIWGSGVRDVAVNQDATNSQDDSNVLSRRQRAGTLEISQLYLTYAQEYGALIAGRAPVHFGLGMTHNAGRGLFDHWYDNRDMVGYKIIIGNFYFLPMYGKPSEGLIENNDDVTDYMIQAQYENPENDIEMGVFYQVRRTNDQGVDVPDDTFGGTGQFSRTSMKQVNIYALRNKENFRLGFEAAFQSGETGLRDANGKNISWGGFGVAGELAYRSQGSAWEFGLKAGSASGDDPDTTDKIEGFYFNRNYDVAMLMFNQPLGQDDFFGTRFMTGEVRDGDGHINTIDVETLSNVIYVAPSIKYHFSEKWSLDNTVITGWLGTNPLAGQDVKKSLGYEWDISLNFSPRKGVVWTTQAGLLFPGAAWEGGGQYESSFAFGLTTKAAISF